MESSCQPYGSFLLDRASAAHLCARRAARGVRLCRVVRGGGGEPDPLDARHGHRGDGGGDEPEAVNQALHASVNDLNWSTDKKTVKLLFLIGDAGPHVYPGDYSWETESRNAIARGIQINTVACDGLNRNHESLEIFQKIARLADGKCEFLTYRQEVVDAGGKKSTLVSSAGKMYKVESSSADAWRAGADKLMARGAAVAMPEAGVGSFAEPASSDMRTLAKARAMSPSFSTRASVHAGAGCSVSRADSNLADIVLSATKEAARKKANIDFKD